MTSIPPEITASQQPQGQMAQYDASPAERRHSNPLGLSVNELEEWRAAAALKLESGNDLLQLRRGPTPQDLALFESVKRVSANPDRVDVHALHDRIIREEVILAVQDFLPKKNSSPFSYLAGHVLSSQTIEQIKATPTVFLQRILQTAEAETLGRSLLKAIGWYGGNQGEETSPTLRTQLTARALQLWLNRPDSESPVCVAGYDLRTASIQGKSYQTIQSEFVVHLIKSARAASEKEAVIMSRLFLPRFPSEFRVRDIPPTLRYCGSVVWVNFVNGVNLIQATDAQALDQMTFQQLVNLPIETSREASPEQLELLTLTRIDPALAWAITQGEVAHRDDGNYSDDEIEHALRCLDRHTDELTKAVLQLDQPPPSRLDMAKAQVERIFGKGSFSSDGKKLAWKIFLDPNGFRDTPVLRGKEYDYYSFVDVYASGQFDNKKVWTITESDGRTVTSQKIQLLEDQTIRVSPPWKLPNSIFVLSPHKKLPDIKALFDSAFKQYLQLTQAAYETLINSLLASLPRVDRRILESGEIKIYSLRKKTTSVEAQNETAEMILPLRARNGLILRAAHEQQTVTYELLPRAGVIRRLEALSSGLIGGRRTTEEWKVSRSATVKVSVIRHKDLPFDWDTHSSGTVPKDNASCQAIIEKLGNTLPAIASGTSSAQNTPITLSSERTKAISHLIATELLYVDLKALRKAANGQTAIEFKEAKDKKTLDLVKIFVPFWNSIEDLASGDRHRIINGVFGVFADLVAFVQPVGKFASGSVALLKAGGQLTVFARLNTFGTLTKRLLTSSLRALLPLDGLPQLVHPLRKAIIKLGRSGIFRSKMLIGNAARYDVLRSLPDVQDAGRWRPLAATDDLVTLNGVDDLPVRQIRTGAEPHYRLLDPIASRPYGPVLNNDELIRGRSHYRSLETSGDHVLVELPENVRARELLEVDGRTTLLLDDVPYRLHENTLRRADLVEVRYTALPCRVRRAPGAVCTTSFVTRPPAAPPLPAERFDEAKGWALWFGDTIYTPAGGRAPMKAASFVKRDHLTATIEFRKGIYARVKVNVPEQGLDDTFQVGAIICPSRDGSKHYVFTRLNAGDFYVAERGVGQSLYDGLLPLKKADTLGDELKNELIVVYTGSLNANNVARIHGVEAVERAMKTMDDIAIPLGVTTTPPDNMNWLRVDTSPGEALMFDNSTRMIVTRLPEGASSWTRSTGAPQAFRERTATIFDTLFQSPTSNPANAAAALRIDRAMQKLQRLLPLRERALNARNIAFADVTTVSGSREVYVSVSGAQRTTTRLPLFQHLGGNQVRMGDTTYFNIDFDQAYPRTSLEVTSEGKILAVPLTIKDINTYKPAQTIRPTSLDSESKLIAAIRKKYPDLSQIRSVDVATTMRPCESCSVVLKEFGHDGADNALKVLWG